MIEEFIHIPKFILSAFEISENFEFGEIGFLEKIGFLQYFDIFTEFKCEHYNIFSHQIFDGTWKK